MGDRGRIDLGFRSGIEGNQGRSPGLYTFYGDDLLMIVYPEGGWAKDAVEKQELRKPPTQFGSDGSRNLWVLRRAQTVERNRKAIQTRGDRKGDATNLLNKLHQPDPNWKVSGAGKAPDR